MNKQSKKATMIRLKVLIKNTRKILYALEDELQRIIDSEER